MPGWTVHNLDRALQQNTWIRACDRYKFASDGYMVIRSLVPASLVAGAVHDIAAYVGADLADSRTWYNTPAVLDGVVPATGRLMLDINRCMFRPPIHPLHPTRSQGDIHWDTDPRTDVEPTLQAVVLLSPISKDRGGFQSGR